MKSFSSSSAHAIAVMVFAAVTTSLWGNSSLLLLPMASAQGVISPPPLPPYQALATQFIVENPLPNITVIEGTFRYALACLWYASNKVETVYTLEQLDAPIAGWTKTTNWMTNKPVCTWYGITCRNSIVTKIDLHNNGLTGYFPNELAILGPGLEYLDLSENLIASVGGQLSWMSSMVKLKHLDLFFCNVDYGSGIPPYINKMVDIEYMDLSYCFLRGDLDGAPFLPLTKLRFLTLAGNSFEATPIPTQILTLPSLQELYIENSNVADDFADIINTVNKNISVLWVNNNALDGTIPTTISSLTTITTLSATGAGLFGSIPGQMGRLTTLRELFLFNNSLTGTIPGQMSALTNLISFQTEDNMLRGSMPNGVCNLRSTNNNNGLLTDLSTDCSGNAPEVSCTCCNCCVSPCFETPPITIAPTPAPTSKPTSAPTSGGFICFSGNNMVQVLSSNNNNNNHHHPQHYQHDATTTTTTTTKMIRMDQLQIGDYVLSTTSSPTTVATTTTSTTPHYSKVYSFGHYNNSTMGEYLQLHTTTTTIRAAAATAPPLELSMDHMVFVSQRGAIPASAVQIGDELVMVLPNKSGTTTTSTTTTAKVTKITTVQRKGAYAPFTESGTIVVNHVLASNYVSLQAPSEYFMIPITKNIHIPIISMHWLAHAFQAPHRIWSRSSHCVMSMKNRT